MDSVTGSYCELRQEPHAGHVCPCDDGTVLFVHYNRANIKSHVAAGAKTQDVGLDVGPMVRPTQGSYVGALTVRSTVRAHQA